MAHDYAERAVSLAPDNPWCHISLASVLGRTNNGDPADHVIVSRVAGALRAISDPRPAIEHHTRAIELAPNWPGPYAARGEFYFAIGDDLRALADLNRAIEIAPDHPWSRSKRGEILSRLGRFEEALEDFRRCLDRFPHKAIMHERVAYLYATMKDWRAAEVSYTRSLEIAPCKSHVLKRRAAVYVNLQEYAKGLADLRGALEMNPEDTSALWWIPASQLAQTPDEFRQGLMKLADEAVERSPKPAEAYADRAYLCAHRPKDTGRCGRACSDPIPLKTIRRWCRWQNWRSKPNRSRNSTSRRSAASCTAPGGSRRLSNSSPKRTP
jgi:tetratricopeptide (TPR) repeat protein